jgi:Leucine-rich repeat (LRR) protein
MEIDLSRNMIRELDHRIFRHNGKVSKLDLSGNEITALHHDIFRFADLLLYLNVSHNKIQSLEVNLFSSNINVKSLDFSNNLIEHVDSNIFKKNTHLENLNMNNNKLSSLNKDIFSQNMRIESIDMSYNSIAYIHTETFRMNKMLALLNMRKNQLTSVKEELLSNNSKLKIVDFSDNKIVSIDQKAFIRNYEIERVNLSTNGITQLSPDTFDANTKLTEVDLSYNRITVLDCNMFAKTRIKTLNLRGNRLKIEANMSLFTASVLEKLDLGSCGIMSLSTNTFRDMLNLRELLLDSNILKFSGQADPIDNVFSGLNHLVKLDLSVNEISEMSADMLHDLDDLKLLNLSLNPVMCNKCASEDQDIQNWCSTRNVQCVAKCYSATVKYTKCIATAAYSEGKSHGIENKTYENVHTPFPRTRNVDLKDSAVTTTEEGVSFEMLVWTGVVIVFVVLTAAVVVVLIIIFIRRRRPQITFL